MVDSLQEELLNRDVKQWNYWRKQHPEIRPNLDDAVLYKADLRGADLSDADLYEADLGGSDLSDARLNNANMIEADLNHAVLYKADLSDAWLNVANLNNANLEGANLSGADLSGAGLEGADLSGADLSGANLREANLSGVNLQGATVEGTIFAQVDLRKVKGLAELDHLGPSSIELYTIQLPQDGSALHFLRGCGVPDEWIDDYRTHMMRPIQYHSCFISYSSQDDTLARRLHADLQDQGVRCWFAPEDMKIGDKIRARIDEAIHVHEKLLLLLSEAAITSDWVEDEVEAALEKERSQQREVLFPIRLDNTVMETSQAWAAKLRRQRHIGDFTNWDDPQAYQQAFERLLRDLKKAEE